LEIQLESLLSSFTLGNLQKILQREVAPSSAVCVPARSVQHAHF
jgi:hypothetical protein